LIFDSLLLAALAGLLTSGLALITCWAARESPWFRRTVLILMALAWAMPGPVVGIGLKRTIGFLVDQTDSPFLARLLWYGPSLAPLLWVDLIRFFPFAVALLWPVVRLVPRELVEGARIDGATPVGEFLHVAWPLTALATVRAGLAVGILSLGELSAGKLVWTPGKPTFAQELFSQMHYGVTPNLAARCLLLLVVVAGGAVVVRWVSTR
jgi:ABC-type Fe3+ transport system permease subunit